MVDRGFFESRRTNKTGLAVVVAGHVAVLAAVMLAKGTIVIRQPDPPIMVRNIRETTPPPPTAEPRIEKPTRIDRPMVIVPLLPVDPIKPVYRDDMVARTDPGDAIDPGPAILPEPRFVAAVMDPSAAGRFQPDYPPALLRADVEGLASVRILIGVDGRVLQVELVTATDPAFFDATRRQALRYWRFKPATRGGVATESWRTLTVRFKVQG